MLKELGKSVFIYGIASSISKFTGLFLIPIFARYFSPEEYGSLDLISTVVSFVAIFGMLQLESATSRYYYEVEEEERKIYVSTSFWSILLMSFILQLLVMFFANTISSAMFDSLKNSSIIQLASLNIVLLNLFGFLSVLLRFHNKPIAFALVIFFQFAITFLVSTALVFFHKGIIAFFIGQATGLLTGIIFSVIILKNLFVFEIKKKVLKEFLKYSLPQVPAVAGNWLNSYVNRFIMLSSLTLFDIGIYTVALKIASIFNLLENAFRMAWEPYLWAKIKTPNHKQLLRSLSIMLSIIVFSFAIIFMFFSKEALVILSTNEYIGALPIIKILIFAFSFPILTQVFGVGIAVSKKTIYNTIIFLIGVGINIAMLLLLVPKMGLIGVPLSLCASNLGILIFGWYFSEKKYFIGFNYKLETIIIFLFALVSYFIFNYEIALILRIFLFILSLLILYLSRRRISTLIKE